MIRFHSMGKIAFVVAALGLSSQASADLVANGSFESGSFSGWTQFGNNDLTFVTNSYPDVNPTDGSYQAMFGAEGSLGGISQNIATVAGQSYLISFDLANLGDPPSNYQVQFGSTVLADINPPTFPYTSFSFFATAATSLTGLSFTIQQDTSFMLLDNISVTAVPEPEEWAMLLVGIPLIGWQIRRKQANSRDEA